MTQVVVATQNENMTSVSLDVNSTQCRRGMMCLIGEQQAICADSEWHCLSWREKVEKHDDVTMSWNGILLT